MRKNKKISKKALSLCISLILCMNSFAAQISDNDGGAFITKAEFDSLRNDFQSQLNAYQTNIDSKIDSAIASYISGLTIVNEPINYWNKVVKATGGKLRFCNYIASTDYGVSGMTTGKTENLVRRTRVARNTWAVGYANWDSGNGLQYLVAKNTTNLNTYLTGRAILAWALGRGSEGNKIGSWSKTKFDDSESYGHDVDSLGSGTWNKTATKETAVATGSGKVWTYRVNPDNTMTLKNYNDKYYPQMDFNIYGHTYKSWVVGGSTRDVKKANFKAIYTVSTGMDQTASTNAFTKIEFDKLTAYGTNTKGTDPGTSSESAAKCWGNIRIYKVASNNGIDYSLKQWGANTSYELYTIDENRALTVATSVTNRTTPATSYTETLPLGSGPTQCDISMHGVPYTYYNVSLATTKRNLYAFTNNYLSNVVGETVYIGGGAPIFETIEAGQKIKCTLKFKIYNSSGTAVSGQKLKYSISDKQFSKGSAASGANNYVTNKEITVSSTAGTTVTETITVKKKGLVWINFYGSASNYECELNSATFELVK